MKVQAWLEWIDNLFISDNLIVVLQFGNSLLQVHCNPLLVYIIMSTTSHSIVVFTLKAEYVFPQQIH